MHYHYKSAGWNQIKGSAVVERYVAVSSAESRASSISNTNTVLSSS